MATVDTSGVLALYEQYLTCCNDRRWDELGSFVTDRVLVNGDLRTREQYVGDIRATIEVFPDYQWVLRRAVHENDWLAVHLHDKGTRARAFLDAPGDGAFVETDEFNMYRIAGGRIVEVEGTADNARLAR